MKIFLIMKGWQMFVVIIAPMLAPIFVFRGPENFIWLGVVYFLFMLVLVGWLFSVGSEANRRLPDNLKKSTVLYKLGFSVAIVYMGLGAIFIFPNIDLSSRTPMTPPIWMVPMHIASMFGMFYGLWFTAKQFVTLQKQQHVKFIDYSGPFFLFWFAPLGVWFLQPKINELFTE